MLLDIDGLAWSYLTLIHYCYYNHEVGITKVCDIKPRPVKLKQVYINGRCQTSEGYYVDGAIKSKYDFVVGEFKEWHQNGKLSDHWFEKDGYHEGLSKSWWDNGALLFEQFYVNGRLEGYETFWHNTGKLWRKCKYINGKKWGSYLEIYDDGTKERCSYIDDNRHGFETVWFKSGRIKSKTWYVEGVVHGLFREWYENRQIKHSYTLDNGVKNGEYSEWSETGELVRHRYYLFVGSDDYTIIELPI